ncbi:MAG TPA: hypothetical protein VIT66_03650, partial [Lysobacter sp.]
MNTNDSAKGSPLTAASRRAGDTTAVRTVRATIAVACLALGACATTSHGVPYSTDVAPDTYAGLQDKRGRFRETFCAVLEAHGHELPDYRSCDQALTRVGDEPAGTGKPVDLGPSKRHLVAALVPGIGYECFEKWLQSPGTAAQHVRQYGYDLTTLKIDALSGIETNARQIRDEIMAMPADAQAPRLVLIGYSKGAPDILEAVV